MFPGLLEAWHGLSIAYFRPSLGIFKHLSHTNGASQIFMSVYMYINIYIYNSFKITYIFLQNKIYRNTKEKLKEQWSSYNK